MFTLPQGSYHFRADLNGTQFWSAANTTCPLPACTGATVTTTVPLTVTVLDTNRAIRAVCLGGLAELASEGQSTNTDSRLVKDNHSALL